MPTKRKAIPKKIRFEVFKRDNFSCQYCGRSAPDVTLVIDHITPVKNGGQNDIMNLLTSCFDCNSGKGARELSDNQVLQKQREQLAQLNERREQMEMMVKWKEGLLKLDDAQIDVIENILSVTGHSFSDCGRANILKAIKKCGLEIVIDAANISLRQYYKPDDEESVSKAFEYVKRIAYTLDKQKTDPFIGKKNKIRYQMRKDFAYYGEARTQKMLSGLCVSDENCDYILDIAKDSYNWSSFWEEINTCFAGDW